MKTLIRVGVFDVTLDSIEKAIVENSVGADDRKVLMGLTEKIRELEANLDEGTNSQPLSGIFGGASDVPDEDMIEVVSGGPIPFDVGRFAAGVHAVTRDGVDAKFVRMEPNRKYCLVVRAETPDDRRENVYTLNGTFDERLPKHPLDLVAMKF